MPDASWKRIETAPRDGRLVDLWCVSPWCEAKPVRLTDCSWHDADDLFPWTGWVRIVDDGNIDAVECPATTQHGLPPWQPTHWMFPPAAPTTEKQGYGDG